MLWKVAQTKRRGCCVGEAERVWKACECAFTYERGACGAGPGAFDFKQGDTNGTLFWKIVRHFLKEPSADQVACQAPKPIILDTGSVHVPYEW